jgi:hypothetical protein
MWNFAEETFSKATICMSKAISEHGAGVNIWA